VRGGSLARESEVLERVLRRPPVENCPNRQRFLRACFRYQHAGRVQSYSRSAAFTALKSAVETQRFADLLEKHAMPGDSLEAERKKFYTIRSKLSHAVRFFTLTIRPGDLACRQSRSASARIPLQRGGSSRSHW
jgi:hypothetical protein